MFRELVKEMHGEYPSCPFWDDKTGECMLLVDMAIKCYRMNKDVCSLRKIWIGRLEGGDPVQVDFNEVKRN